MTLEQLLWFIDEGDRQHRERGELMRRSCLYSNLRQHMSELSCPSIDAAKMAMRKARLKKYVRYRGYGDGVDPRVELTDLGRAWLKQNSPWPTGAPPKLSHAA